MITPGGVELVWPVGPPQERVGTGLPAGWSIAVGFNADYWLGVHTGIDLNLPGESDFGQPVYAVADGVVVFAGELPGTWGRAVLIHHPHLGLWSQYAHLSAVDVAAGQHVTQGQRIGACGNGATSGHGPTVSAHVHFELRKADIPAGRWPSGLAKSQAPSVHRYIMTNYVDPVGRLGA